MACGVKGGMGGTVEGQGEFVAPCTLREMAWVRVRGKGVRGVGDRAGGRCKRRVAGKVMGRNHQFFHPITRSGTPDLGNCSFFQ